MVYTRYFKPGQKILLRVLEPAGRYETLTSFFHLSAGGCFDLTLPYRSRGDESYPFIPDMPFELLSDHLGLGLRLTGRFREQVSENLIRVEILSDLQVFQRRLNRRLDLTVGLRYTKGRGTLRSFRDQWEKNLKILDKTQDFSKLPAFPRSRVNLSIGGIRFDLAPPVEIADLCLILLQLDHTSRPICALTEIIWLDEQQGDGRRTAGMQFTAILEADQKRIETLIKQLGDRS